MKRKKCGFKGGRGYCGYYINWLNEKVFLRSRIEFLFAKYLDKNKQHYKVEEEFFSINGKNYKPDFFIYNHLNQLKEIVELKYSKKEANSAKRKYLNYFKQLGITYTVYDFFTLKHLIKKYVSKEEEQNWVNQCLETYDYLNYFNDRNPMYGLTHSKETKKKIGLKTSERFQNKEFKEKHKKAIQEFWKSEKASKVREKIGKITREAAAKKNPIIKKDCEFCGIEFSTKRKNKKIKKCCSLSCAHKLSWKVGKTIYKGNGKQSYKTKILIYSQLIKEELNEFVHNDLIKNYKKLEKIPKNFGMDLHIILKYFESYENFLKILRGKI